MMPPEIDRLAAAINALRPDWPASSLRTFIDTHLAGRALPDAAIALTWVACDPTSRTPKRVLESGPWWQATRPADAQRTYTEPGVVTRCEHGQPSTQCTDCYPRQTAGVGPTPEQRAAIRAAIAAAASTNAPRPAPTGATTHD